MMKLMTLGFVFAVGLQACTPAVEYSAEGPTVSLSDLAVLTGDDWVGSLTYLDYSSGEMAEIATKVSIQAPESRQITYTISYPDEPWEDGTDTIKLSEDGRLVDGYVVIQSQTGEAGEVMFMTEHAGEDDNQPATIRMAYRVAPKEFQIRKDVKFEASEAFITRSTYAFSR
ncbi:hypothetical protein ACJ3XI_07510 [Litorimonas sp. RW-G-Af-16]|uniref:hypothetical protein n=1 Tax=Litorimonas sp. RW-G-Af-16 TaxID=3241168 RepID=UPI00390C98CE